jgi:hypothetical protein
MFRWFWRRPAGRGPDDANELPAVDMIWLADRATPTPDWAALLKGLPTAATAEACDRYWRAVARQWLQRLGDSLGADLALHMSGHFLLLSRQSQRHAEMALSFLELTRRRILRYLDGIAVDAGHGPMVAIALAPERYDAYVAQYYPTDGEFSDSSGMFVRDGYGHFVIRGDSMSEFEATIVHEMAHNLVSHLPIPAWLNEGIAVNTEARHAGLRFSAPDAPWSPAETSERHRRHWNNQRIQRFWAGKSFIDAGDAQPLSYDLAMKMVQVLGTDWPPFVRFANEASMADAGAAAAELQLGHPIENVVTAILGEGPWRPMPATWNQGVERGRFRIDTQHIPDAG